MHFYCRSNFNRTQALIFSLSPSLQSSHTNSLSLALSLYLTLAHLFAFSCSLASFYRPDSIPVCLFATLLLTTCSVFFFFSHWFCSRELWILWCVCNQIYIFLQFLILHRTHLPNNNNHDGKIGIHSDHNLIIFIDAGKMENIWNDTFTLYFSL